MELLEILKKRFTEIAAGLGLELVELKLIRLGGRLVVRAIIHKQGGVTINDCKTASRAFGDFLDLENPIDCRFVLEVSSIGLDKPLLVPDDFRRRLGESVKLEIKPGLFPGNVLEGKLVGADKMKLRLDMNGNTIDLDYENVIRGKILF